MQPLVHPRERVYFALCVGFSALVYALVVWSVVGIVYLLLAVMLWGLLHVVYVGAIEGNAVRVSERQFPDVHGLVERLSLQIGLPSPPAVYVVQAGGLLNAFATRFLGRDFVVISTDALELATANGEPALGFVLAHELAHLRRRHTTVRPYLFPALVLPFLGTAYTRACEYTCDAMAARCRPDGAADGLRVLAAGKHLYTAVDVSELVAQGRTSNEFWPWLAEMLSAHPFLPKRLAALPEMARSAGRLSIGTGT